MISRSFSFPCKIAYLQFGVYLRDDPGPDVMPAEKPGDNALTFSALPMTINNKSTSNFTKTLTTSIMATKHTPVPNGMTSFWRTEPHPLDSHRSTEFLPEECDIVIVGAGYAGSSVAHHILSQTPVGVKPPSIMVLEARQACSGATGRNGERYNFHTEGPSTED